MREQLRGGSLVGIIRDEERVVEHTHVRVVDDSKRDIDVRFLFSRLLPFVSAISTVHDLSNVMPQNDVNAEVLLSSDVTLMSSALPCVVRIEGSAEYDLDEFLRSYLNESLR